MHLPSMFHIGSRRIAAQGCQVSGTVTKVTRCWWLKVNTKPVRLHSLDGARFPHILTFSYEAAGASRQGRLWLSSDRQPPAPGTHIGVYYDPAHPDRYACQDFTSGASQL